MQLKPSQVEACIARLYRMSDNNPDQETPPASAAWRESCKKAIIPDVNLSVIV